MTPEEANPRVHHVTVKGARNSLARKEISQESYAAVLRGELSLADAKELGRSGAPTDTSEGTTVQDAPTGTPGRPCLCGCGQPVRGKKSRFRPGHDARLHGELKRQLRSDPLLRSDKFTDEQRRYAVERDLAGPEVLPEGEQQVG